jgi:hypothetical protein
VPVTGVERRGHKKQGQAQVPVPMRRVVIVAEPVIVVIPFTIGFPGEQTLSEDASTWSNYHQA